MKLLIAAAMLAATPAAAQLCAPVQDITATLATSYGEAPVARGLMEGGILVWLANIDTGTWTLISVSPQGVACVAAAGTDFDADAPKKGEAL